MLNGAHRENIITTAIFLACMFFLAGISIYNAFTISAGTLASEKRSLASFPKIADAGKDLPKFASGLEAFFNDRFAFRSAAITFRNMIVYQCFHSSGSNKVAIGKNGWLYCAEALAPVGQINAEPFSEDAVRCWVRMLQTRRDWLAARNIKYIFLVAPEKASIYPEFLPDSWQRRPGPSRLDQLTGYLKTHTNIDIIDTAAILKQAKTEQILYYKGDTHWNSYGAFLIAQEILRTLSNSFASVKPFSKDSWQFTSTNFKGDLANMLGLARLLSENCIDINLTKTRGPHRATAYKLPLIEGCTGPCYAIETANSSLPRALFLRDSFMGSVEPYLSENFKFSDYYWTSRFAQDVILSEKPDVVIQEIAERHLYDSMPDNIPEFLTDTRSQCEAVSAAAPHTHLCDRTPDRAGAAGSKDLALFHGDFALKDIEACNTESGIIVKLLWRSRVKQTLRFKMGVHAIDKVNGIVGSVDLDQDWLKRPIKPGSIWRDTIIIPHEKTAGAKYLGVVMYEDSSRLFPVVSKSSDWYGSRFIISLSDAERNAQQSRSLSVAESKPEDRQNLLQ